MSNKVEMPSYDTMSHITTRIKTIIQAQVISKNLTPLASLDLQRAIDGAIDQWYEEP